MNWFRVYHDIVDDPKFMTLPLEVLGFWVVALSVASSRPERGTLPDVDELAFRTRQPIDKAREYVDLMLARKFLVRDKSGKLSVYKWEEYQPAWDDSKTRQRERRARLKSQKKDADPADVSRDSHVTVTDQRRGEEIREEFKPPAPPAAAAPPVTPAPVPPPPPPDGDDLERWAREALGDAFDLHSFGPSLRAWRGSFPADRIRYAFIKCVATGNLTPAYAFGCLKAPDRKPADPGGAALSPSQRRNQDLVNGFKRLAEEARRKEATDGHG